MRVGWIIILFAWGIVSGNAQNTALFTFHKTPVKDALKKIEQQTGYIFSYSPSILDSLLVETISVK